MNLKQKIENNPIMAGLSGFAVVLTVLLSAKTLLFPSSPNITNNGSGDINNAGHDVNVFQSPKEKSPGTPEGAREALSREGKSFDEEALVDSVREGNIEQLKLYLIGGKSPNELYNNRAPLLGVAITSNAPHFEQILDLFVKWKPDPLDFTKVDPRILIGGRIRGIPLTQQNALFTDLVDKLLPDGSAPPEIRKDAELLIHKGASPDEIIKATEILNRDISADESQALKNGVDQERDAQINGMETPKQIIDENLRTVNFLKSLKH